MWVEPCLFVRKEHVHKTRYSTPINFTLLGFTALNGELVLCLVILPGVKTFGEVTDTYYFDKNFGSGKLFPGGPTCMFQNKDIPCMVRWLPKGSITS